MCPKCRSTNVRSNHISDEIIGQVLHGAHAMQHAGLRALAVAGLGTAGVMKGINSLRERWHCNTCDNKFS